MMTLDSPPILALKIPSSLWFLTILKKWKKAIAEMEIQKAWDLENEMKQILSAQNHRFICKMETFWRTNQTCSFGEITHRNQSTTHSYFVDYGRAYQSPGCGNGRMARKLFE